MMINIVTVTGLAILMSNEFRPVVLLFPFYARWQLIVPYIWKSTFKKEIIKPPR